MLFLTFLQLKSLQTNLLIPYKGHKYPKGHKYKSAYLTLFTYQLGRLLNKIEGWLEKKFPSKKRKHHEFIHELAMIHLEIRENRMVITRSLSFGLILFCVGLILTTIYLLMVYK